MKIICLYKKYKEIINYIFFGLLTTGVNFLVYYFCFKILNLNYIIANIVAWILSVAFAYVGNRLYVFKKVNFSKIDILREMIMFFGARFMSGAIETMALFLMVSILCIGEFLAKIIVSIIVVILNYVFSKLLVFRKYS